MRHDASRPEPKSETEKEHSQTPLEIEGINREHLREVKGLLRSKLLYLNKTQKSSPMGNDPSASSLYPTPAQLPRKSAIRRSFPVRE